MNKVVLFNYIFLQSFNEMAPAPELKLAPHEATAFNGDLILGGKSLMAALSCVQYFQAPLTLPEIVHYKVGPQGIEYL